MQNLEDLGANGAGGQTS